MAALLAGGAAAFTRTLTNDAPTDAASAANAPNSDAPPPHSEDPPGSPSDTSMVTRPPLSIAGTAGTQGTAVATSSTTAELPSDPITITITSTTDTTTEQPTPPSSKVEPSGPRQVVSGTVTEVFTDCASWLVLNDEGAVEDGGPISCDGGSYIMVGTIRIKTSAGYVAPGSPYYDKHIADLLPGTTVSVVTMEDPNGPHTLNCEDCGISVAIHG